MKTILLICLLTSLSVHAVDWDLMSDPQIIEELNRTGEKLEVSNGVVYYEKGQLSESGLKKTKEEFEAAIKEVLELLGISLKRERYKDSLPALYIYHAVNSGPHIYFGHEHHMAEIPAIFIPSPIIKANYAPIFHEVVHLVTENFWSHSLREGLADFVQFYLRPGQKASMKMTVLDFHSHAREVLKKESRVFKFVGGEGYHYDSIQERIDFYQLSRSFVTYLIHQYGGAKFLKLYETKNGYNTICNKSLDQLKSDWTKAVKVPVTVKDLSDDPFREPRLYYWLSKVKNIFKFD